MTIYINITYPLSCAWKNECFFLHCVDSHLKENGNWYSRFHIGPFIPGSGLQIGIRLRHSLHNDLVQIFIWRIELEGVDHEFRRLKGVYDPILDIIFQFRKVVLYAPLFKFGETIVIPICFFGSGIICRKDINWPSGIGCSNPDMRLFTLARGRIVRGHLSIQKNSILCHVPVSGNTLRFEKSWKMKCRYRNIRRKNLNSCRYPWISLGNPIKLVQRRGFRVESEKLLDNKSDRLVFEIVTSGGNSPRSRLQESVISLLHKLIIISKLLRPRSITNKFSNYKNYDFYQIFLKYFGVYTPDLNISIQAFYQYFDLGFFRSREPLRLDLRNLDLTKERYIELRNLGFFTLGQLVEGLAYKRYLFSPMLKQQRQHSLFKMGIFFIYLRIYG
jgi:DNA-directed RNA polymerase alpha subunit